MTTNPRERLIFHRDLRMTFCICRRNLSRRTSPTGRYPNRSGSPNHRDATTPVPAEAVGNTKSAAWNKRKPSLERDIVDGQVVVIEDDRLWLLAFLPLIDRSAIGPGILQTGTLQQ